MVSQSHIDRSTQQEKIKTEGKDKNLAELIANSGTKQLNSYGQLGGSLNLLHYISIAAYTAKIQTISQTTTKICERMLCATSPATAARFIRSWAASYHSLSVFGRLDWKWGQHQGIIRLHEYMVLSDTTEYSQQFYNLLQGDREVGGDVSSQYHTTSLSTLHRPQHPRCTFQYVIQVTPYYNFVLSFYTSTCTTAVTVYLEVV